MTSHATQSRPIPLLWRVFLANVAVFVIALLLLTFSPIEVSFPIKFSQFLLLLAGFIVLVVMNLFLLRRVLSPLSTLTAVMSSVDPDTPGLRLSAVDSRSAEGEALVHAFNGMLDRLESARHEAARTALQAQEAERLRVAQELHDEIGQTLTAVTIQAERAADGDAGAAAGGAPAGGRRRPREPRRGAPHRARAAARGARRPRPRERPDRALQPHVERGRAAHQAGAAGDPASPARGGGARPLPGRAGEHHERDPALRTPTRSASGSRGTRTSSRSASATTGTACRAGSRAARPGSAGCASARCWSAGGSRSSPCPRAAPRCG